MAKAAKHLSLLTAGALTAGLLVALLLLLAAEPAGAAFPGENGKIVFVSNRLSADSPEGDEEIYTMDPDGNDVTRLTTNAARDFAPAFSPDGSKIAFVSDRDGNREIFVMD